MKNLMILLLLLSGSFTFAQKTKKITFKNDYPSYKETFYVLKSDEAVKHGTYDKSMRGKSSIKGQFDNGKKSGIWEYYDADGKLAHKIDIPSKKLLYDKFAKENLKFDTTKYSKSFVILGGFNSFYQKIGDNLRYPADARRKGTQGKVMIKIIITKEGEIYDVRVLDGLGDGLDEEAVRVIKMIDFEALPALDLDGKPTESEMIIPVSFLLG